MPSNYDHPESDQEASSRQLELEFEASVSAAKRLFGRYVSAGGEDLRGFYSDLLDLSQSFASVLSNRVQADTIDPETRANLARLLNRNTDVTANVVHDAYNQVIGGSRPEDAQEGNA